MFTRANGMKSAGLAALDDDPANTLIFVCSSANGVTDSATTPTCGTDPATVQLTDRAPAVIWSVGANASSAGASPDEARNAFPPGVTVDRLYVSHGMNSKAGSEFDDVVTWLSIGNLVSLMVLAGQLP